MTDSNSELNWPSTIRFEGNLDPTLVEHANRDFELFKATVRENGWHVILKEGMAEITDPKGDEMKVPASTSDELIAALSKHRDTLLETNPQTENSL